MGLFGELREGFIGPSRKEEARREAVAADLWAASATAARMADKALRAGREKESDRHLLEAAHLSEAARLTDLTGKPHMGACTRRCRH